MVNDPFQTRRFSLPSSSLPAHEIQIRSAFARQFIQIVRKFEAHSHQVLTKTTATGQPRFQAFPLACRTSGRQAAGKQGSRQMRFLVRMTFWLGVVLILLPSGGSQPVPKSQVGVGDAFSAAKAAMSDMQQFCGRQPQVCDVGSQTAVTLGQRAQAGAKILYEFLQQQFGNDEPASAVQSTGSVRPSTVPSQHTLRPDDLSPPWRGPDARDSARG
jgi:hypothetical protein